MRTRNINIILDDSNPSSQILIAVEDDFGESLSVEDYGIEGRSGKYRVIHIPVVQRGEG